MLQLSLDHIKRHLSLDGCPTFQALKNKRKKRTEHCTEKEKERQAGALHVTVSLPCASVVDHVCGVCLSGICSSQHVVLQVTIHLSFQYDL